MFLYFFFCLPLSKLQAGRWNSVAIAHHTHLRLYSGHRPRLWGAIWVHPKVVTGLAAGCVRCCDEGAYTYSLHVFHFFWVLST